MGIVVSTIDSSIVGIYKFGIAGIDQSLDWDIQKNVMLKYSDKSDWSIR